jgi:phospholipid/cholesterol/gamma-HCH transport system permease protein
MKRPAFALSEPRRDGDALVVGLSVDETRTDFADADAALKSLPDDLPPVLRVELGEGVVGSRAAAVLDRFCAAAEARGARVIVRPFDAAQRATLERHAETTPTTPPARRGRRGGLFDPPVRALLLLRETLDRGLFGFLRPGRSRLDATLLAIVETGVRAIPLTLSLNFLLGAVLALQAAPFLAKYGQEILTAQLVAMAQLREIGPLLTAILVAGRTASSLAAEIGAMKSAEELDALEVLGSSPVDVLVAPRWRALVLSLPALTLIADAAGIAGGLAVGVLALDLPAEAWIDQTIKASRFRDVVGGLAKSAAFATTLVVVAAYHGFAAEKGAVGVARRTTRSVVHGIFAVVVVDAFFTLVIYGMDL